MAALHADDREVDVVLDRQAAEQPRLLVGAGEAHARAGARRERGDVAPEQLDVARRRGEVAADDVEERRLAGAVRAEDRAPLAGRDLEIDVANGMKAAEPPADPPQAEGRLGVFGCCCFGQTAYLRIWVVILPFVTTWILPCHGVVQLLARRLRAAGRRARRLEQAAERLVHARDVRDHLRTHRPVGVLDELELVLVLDRLAAGVELDLPAVRDLERAVDRPRQRRLELRPDGTTGLGEPDGPAPSRPCSSCRRSRRPRPPSASGTASSRRRGTRRPSGCGRPGMLPKPPTYAPTTFGADDLVRAEEAEEQVADVLLRVELAVGLLVRLQRRRRYPSRRRPRSTRPPGSAAGAAGRTGRSRSCSAAGTRASMMWPPTAQKSAIMPAPDVQPKL